MMRFSFNQIQHPPQNQYQQITTNTSNTFSFFNNTISRPKMLYIDIIGNSKGCGSCGKK